MNNKRERKIYQNKAASTDPSHSVLRFPNALQNELPCTITYTKHFQCTTLHKRVLPHDRPIQSRSKPVGQHSRAELHLAYSSPVPSFWHIGNNPVAWLDVSSLRWALLKTRCFECLVFRLRGWSEPERESGRKIQKYIQLKRPEQTSQLLDARGNFPLLGYNQTFRPWRCGTPWEKRQGHEFKQRDSIHMQMAVKSCGRRCPCKIIAIMIISRSSCGWQQCVVCWHHQHCCLNRFLEWC